MAATALLKFTQNLTVGANGQALKGVVGTLVNVANSNNTDIASWQIDLLYVDPASGIIASTPYAFSNNSSTPAASFTPDVTGSFRWRLMVWAVANRVGSPVDTDIRVFTVPEAGGLVVPPTQIWPLPLPDPQSGLPGAKPNEMNFNAQPDGWAGNGDGDGGLNDLIRRVGPLPAAVSTLQGAVSALISDVNTLESDVTTLSGNVTTLSGTVSTLSSTVSTLQGNVTTLQGTVSTLSSAVGTLQTNLTNLTTLVAAQGPHGASALAQNPAAGDVVLTLLASGHTAGTYEVSGYLEVVTAPTSGAVDAIVGFTSTTGAHLATMFPSLPNLVPAGELYWFTQSVRSNGTAAITLKFDFSNVVGTGSVNCYGGTRIIG